MNFGFGVGIEMSERDQNFAIYGEKWTRSSFGIELRLSSDIIYIEFAQSYSKIVSPWMLRDFL
ncbi:hypothetical protein E2C01_054050 [Portunus trituberculatus]|uniref:Uncharacterized protein n=1 Tax=Portunus trituberculatus TaxID=210409 RepID=A0A5B7GTW9_PORTR|nr:hypothetical protein [Portunus trituberculatus]